MVNKLIDEKINDYVDALSSGAPTPGGGAVAALTAAQGAALIMMVANLTVGKKKYAEFGNGFGCLLRRGADFFLLQAQKHDSVEQFEAQIELFSDAGAVLRTVLGAQFDKIGEHFVVELAIVGKLLGSEKRFVEFCQRFYDIEVDL